MKAVDPVFDRELQQALREVSLADLALGEDLSRLKSHAAHVRSYSAPIAVLGGLAAFKLLRRVARRPHAATSIGASAPAKAGLAALALRMALPTVAGFVRERAIGWQGSTVDRSGFSGPGAGTSGAAQGLPRVSASLDRARFAGRWFEVASLDASATPDARSIAGAETTLVMVPVPEGFDVERSTSDTTGVLAVRSGVLRPTHRAGHPSELSISWAPSWLQWAPFAWSDFWVLEIDTGYGFALIGNRARTSLAVLSRTPVIDESVLSNLLRTAADEGYEVERVVRMIAEP